MRLAVVAVLVVAVATAVVLAGTDIDGDDRIVYEQLPSDVFDAEPIEEHLAQKNNPNCLRDLAATYGLDACGRPACTFMHYRQVNKPAKALAVVSTSNKLCSDSTGSYPAVGPGAVSQAFDEKTRGNLVAYYFGPSKASIYKIYPRSGQTTYFTTNAPSSFVPINIQIEKHDNGTFLSVLTSGDLWELNIASPSTWVQVLNYDLRSAYFSNVVGSRSAYSPDDGVHYISGYLGDPDRLISICGLKRDAVGGYPVTWVSIPTSVTNEMPKALYWNNEKKLVLMLTTSDELWWVDPKTAFDLSAPEPPETKPVFITKLNWPTVGQSALTWGVNADKNGWVTSQFFAMSSQAAIGYDIHPKNPKPKQLFINYVNGSYVSGPLSFIY